MRLSLAILITGLATPAAAQHAAHDTHAGHAQSDEQAHAQAPTTADHGGANHDPMDHGAMDHDAMDHATMGHDASKTNSAPTLPATEPVAAAPPVAAGSGRPRAADAVWGEQAMRASRERLRREHGGMALLWVQADRLELRSHEGPDGFLWDVQGWYGGDIDKLWFKSEGEGELDGPLEAAEVQALWSHAIGPWFDLQVGVRQDLTGPTRTHAVVGVQGLAPYLFEVDAAAFLSDQGDLTARIEGELDQRITQRLILQPRIELGLSAQDIPELGVGRGLDHLEAGLRLRYEFTPEFAPYVGVEQEWKTGRSAAFARAEGEDPSVTNVVVGLRFWF